MQIGAGETFSLRDRTWREERNLYNAARVLASKEGKMRRSRNEVARWRMSRQIQRRRARWLEGQSRRYGRMHAIRHQLSQQQRRSILFITQLV